MGWKPISDERARQMYETGRADPTAKFLAKLWGWVFAAGLMPKRWVRLEVRGRTSGEMRSFPLGMSDVDGEWYLVSMLGESAWVRNVRAAGGHAALRRRTSTPCTLTEVPVEERPAVLRRYVEKVPGGRPHIPLDHTASLDEFAEIAADYPVFHVTPR